MSNGKDSSEIGSLKAELSVAPSATVVDAPRNLEIVAEALSMNDYLKRHIAAAATYCRDSIACALIWVAYIISPTYTATLIDETIECLIGIDPNRSSRRP